MLTTYYLSILLKIFLYTSVRFLICRMLIFWEFFFFVRVLGDILCMTEWFLNPGLGSFDSDTLDGFRVGYHDPD